MITVGDKSSTFSLSRYWQALVVCPPVTLSIPCGCLMLLI